MTDRAGIRGFFVELRRRQVIRVALVYAVVAWAMVEVADTVAPRLGLPDWFPTLVIVAAGLGFPIALVLAWAFDLTPKGLERTPSAPGIRGPGRAAGGGLVLAGVVVLFVALGAALRLGLGSTPDGDQPQTWTSSMRSIAVLPFLNFSADPANEHLGDGLAEELLNALAQLPELRVAARTSSFAFKDTPTDVTEIGRRLNVETVLEGSVRRSGQRLRITAQLINASDGYHVWSETFERELQDIFDIQDEISRAIVRALLPRLARETVDAATRHATGNVAAYELYLRGRHHFWQGGEAALRAAAKDFEEAIRLDPAFSVAHASLSDAYMLLAGYAPPAEVMPRAKAAALRSIELDPRLAEGYVALASINYLYDWDWAGADRHYRRSFSANPLLHTRCICYAWYLAVVGDMDAAVVEAERAREMDPLARLPRAIAAWMYYLAGRTHDAETEVAALMEMSRDDVTGRRIRAWLLWDRGERGAAIEELDRTRRELQRRPGSPPPTILEAELASMRALVGQTQEARALLGSLQERSRRQHVPPEHIAAVEAALGDHDSAFASLDLAIEARSNLGQFTILPLSRPLRNDLRYATLMDRVGLGALASPRP
jgi:adenylate cyclase